MPQRPGIDIAPELYDEAQERIYALERALEDINKQCKRERAQCRHERAEDDLGAAYCTICKEVIEPIQTLALNALAAGIKT